MNHVHHQAAFDALDTVARSMNMAVKTSLSSQVQMCGIPCEVQATMEDLAFEGNNLLDGAQTSYYIL